MFWAGGALVGLAGGCSNTCRNGEKGWVNELVQQGRVGNPPFGVLWVKIGDNGVSLIGHRTTPINGLTAQVLNCYRGD